MSTRETLQEYIDQLAIIDTHEHFPVEAARPQNTDVLTEWLCQYFSCDLRSAGLSRKDFAEVYNGSSGLMNRWKIAEPYWHRARSTGYGRALDLTAQGVYGFPRIDADTIEPLNAAFQAARAAGGHYDRVLGEKSNIALAIRDPYIEDDPPASDRIVFAPRVEGILYPNHRTQLRAMGEAEGMTIHRLSDWMELADRTVARWFDTPGTRAACLKCGIAYHRSLHFEKATYAEAEAEFNDFFREANASEWRQTFKPGKKFQDYMMHHLCALADQRGLPYQIHTGIQEGVGNVLADSNPTLLSNLFLEYENVHFDLFHMSYPYMMEAGTLAKNFPNVNIDMCWGHIISPTAARRALCEWLDAVPASKISAFGGDHGYVDGAYGHQRLARENVAASLAEKVDEGTIDLDRARELAHWLFYDNPRRILQLDKFLK